MSLRKRKRSLAWSAIAAIGLTIASTSVAASPSAVPSAVEAFEMYCYQTGAVYDKTVALTKLTGLARMSHDMEKAMGPEVGGGQGYVINVDKTHRKMLLLGTSPTNTCSVSALGHDTSRIVKSMKSLYHLNLLDSSGIGLQVNEMYVPGRDGNDIKAISVHGLIGIVKANDNSVITISYVSPEAAMRVISANHSDG